MQKTRIGAVSKRIVSFALTAVLILGYWTGISAQAKTIYSEKGENIFFYALNDGGKSVLLKVVPLEDLKKISHGQLSGVMTGTDTGIDYNISTTDNYPTTQFCEARGITVPELVDYIKRVTTVQDAKNVSFSGSDIIRLMATDSFGNYSRAWSYAELYGVERYYFEGLYDNEHGWNPGWEIAGDDNSKFGIGRDVYYSEYKDKDPYYDDKRAVFATGVRTVPVLATESFSGRTTSATLEASTEIGIAGYIEKNGGVVAGCLSDVLEDTWSLRLSLPMTESDLMGARRTAYDNFKWIYNLRLDMASAPAIKSQGTVAEPQANIKLSADGKSLTIALSCETNGAMLYYSFDGSPQIPYNGAVTLDVAGRDLVSEPVTFYMTAVKEGWDDAGIIVARYPGLPPAFETLYNGMIGEDLVFSAASGVTAEEWTAWMGALSGVAVKTPTVNGYLTLDKNKYAIDNAARTITFDKNLFTDPGSYSFIFRASKYSNKSVSLTMKKAAPAVKAAESFAIGGDIVLTFDDGSYQSGMSVYVTPPGENASLISSTYLDRTVSGKMTIKASYFDSPSCPIKEPGAYLLELRNSSYSPGEQSVEITVEAGSGFSDVSAGAWYFEAIKYAAETGLFGGTGDRRFSPDAGMTRAMFVTVLGRLEGVEADDNEVSSFTDVDSGEWYTAAVDWAAENNIVGGIGGGRFDPDRQISREEMAAILYRYSVYSKRDMSAASELSDFPDAETISSWASDALKWTVGSGLMNGMSDGRLAPRGTATRAQVAQVIMKYCLWQAESEAGGKDYEK